MMKTEGLGFGASGIHKRHLLDGPEPGVFIWLHVSLMVNRQSGNGLTIQIRECTNYMEVA